MFVRAIAYLAMLLTCGQALARGSGLHSEDPYNSEHFDNLPTEIRAFILRRCTSPKALHYFAGYFDKANRIVLHFEHLHCDQTDAFCKPSGCLHQVWVFNGGQYRLMHNYYAPTGD